MTKDCAHVNLEFKGWIAAPGYGQSWECSDCGEAMWSPCSARSAVPYNSLDRLPELGIEDIV